MSSLQFLNKKSWHVGTKKNEENVWLREQAAKKEAARIAELQKQLNEERKLEEVRRLESQSGNSSTAHRAPRVDWMYEGPGAAMPGTEEAAKAAADAAAAAREDALLGKTEAVLPASNTGSNDGAAVALGADADFNDELVMRDAEVKLREDPMLAILMAKAHEAKKRGAVLQVNPVAQRTHKPPMSAADRARKAEKAARKLERARIREQRRLRRQERSGRDALPTGQSESDDDLDRPRRDHKSSRREHLVNDPSDMEGGCRLAEKPSNSETRGLKRPRAADDNNRTPTLNGSHAVGEGTGASKADKFGLVLPSGGSGVVVTSRFEPKPRLQANLSVHPDKRKIQRHSKPPLPGTKPDRDALRARMQADASVLEEERISRLRRNRRDDDDIMQSRSRGRSDLGPSFMHDFARDAMARAER